MDTIYQIKTFKLLCKAGYNYFSFYFFSWFLGSHAKFHIWHQCYEVHSCEFDLLNALFLVVMANFELVSHECHTILSFERKSGPNDFSSATPSLLLIYCWEYMVRERASPLVSRRFRMSWSVMKPPSTIIPTFAGNILRPSICWRGNEKPLSLNAGFHFC